MFKDFKDFALKGNVVDLAIGVIIGAAFAKIVTSLVEDVIMPVLGLATGNVNFENLFVDLSGKGYATLAAAKAAGASTINYGLFLNTVVNFLLVAGSIFLVVRQIQRSRPAPIAPVPARTCPYCATAIPITATRCPNCTSIL